MTAIVYPNYLLDSLALPSFRNMSIHKVGTVKRLKQCARSGLLGVNTRRYIGALTCVCGGGGGGGGGVGVGGGGNEGMGVI